MPNLELFPCPFCGVEGEPDPVNEGWFAIRHTEVCYFTQNGRGITAHHVPMHQNWNSRASTPIAPVVDVPELDSDDDFALIADAINVARKVQEFIWGGCYPALRPYDAEGWRRLFQKRVDCIAAVDLTRHGGLAALRKRLLQQAALSIKALALVNRWARNSQTVIAHIRDGADGLPLSPATPASTVACEYCAAPERFAAAVSLPDKTPGLWHRSELGGYYRCTATVGPQEQSDLPLLGYERVITVEWDKHNARRHELIEAKRARLLSESEISELAELQWLAGIKRELANGPAAIQDESV